MSLTKTYVDGPFGQLHVRSDAPRGDTSHAAVLLMHPNPLSGRLYEPLIAELATDRAAIAIDIPGCGNSSPPPSAQTIPDYAAALEVAIRKLGHMQVDIFAAQTGARISAALAERSPSLVRRMVLMHAPAYTQEERDRARKNYKSPEIDLEGAHLLAEWKTFVAQVPASNDLPLVADLFADSMLHLQRAHRNWIVQANLGYPYEDHIPKLTQPILVLNPEGFLKVPTSRMAPLLRNGKVVEIPHTVPENILFRAPEMAKIARDFFDT